MKPDYHPFKRRTIIETPHGIINTERNRYFTHRKPEHYFKKHQGFAVSDTEIDMARREGCTHIIIKYHGKASNYLYMIEMKYLEYMDKHDNNGDIQTVIPIKATQLIGTEELE